MFSETVLLRLVASIYDAAGDPQLWSVFLEQFAETVGGAATLMFLYDVKGHDGNIAATVRLDPEDLRKYSEHYIQVDQWGIQGAHLIKSGNVVTGQMLCPDQVLERSEFCNDFLRPMDAFHQFCGFIRTEQSVASIISCLRPKRDGPFGEKELRLLRVLMPHLQRAFQFHQRIVALQRNADVATEALDRLAIGFLLVDAAGKILMSNRLATTILQQNDGLAIIGGRLHAAREREANRLRDLIRQAAATGSGLGFESGGMMTVPRPSHRRAFEILVAPLRAGALPLGVIPPRQASAIFVLDPENQPEPNDEVLVRLFGLTPAEARLAILLIHGKSLTQAAEEFGLSRNTIRSQLQKVFYKTGTTRQGELVSLLWNSLARLRTK
jgi:DNA-binding CsgD family transcriptional regulator/PAS domain-containing protein